MDPKPVIFTQSDTNPSNFAPQPMVVVGGIPVPLADVISALEGVTGYDAADTQTLKNVDGTLTWVDDA